MTKKQRIEQELGEALCTVNNPCAAVVMHLGRGRWMIADDGASEECANYAEALRAAKSWRKTYAEAWLDAETDKRVKGTYDEIMHLQEQYP